MFPFDNDQREAVITFVLGLVADPPTNKYIYQPSSRQKVDSRGRQVLKSTTVAGAMSWKGEKWIDCLYSGKLWSPAGKSDVPIRVAPRGDQGPAGPSDSRPE
jgi:hypothetical protein